MFVYVGQTRSRSLIARLEALGFGECCNRGEYPPRRHPWFLDNGAYSDWTHGRDFDGAAFLADLISAQADPCAPDFVVCPDRVATGLASLAFSLDWLDTSESLLRAQSLPRPRWYLAVQDGMREASVDTFADSFAGIFVGGTLEWKIRTGAAWVRFAHDRGLPCHIGRVGTPRRVAWAKRIGADSIDSCLPLWSTAKLDAFVAELRRGTSSQSAWGW